MFFRSRKENGKSAEPDPKPKNQGAANKIPTIPATPAKTEANKGSHGDAPSRSNVVADKSLAPAELQKRAEASKRYAATMGEIIGLMAKSPHHRNYRLGDIRWLVVPALRTGQYALATAQSKSQGYTAPVAAILWAGVSPEVDQRLCSNLSGPIRLAPREWKSGDILWVIDAVGHTRLIGGLIRRMQAAEWKGKPVKARVVDAQKQPKIRIIEPHAPPTSQQPPSSK